MNPPEVCSCGAERAWIYELEAGYACGLIIRRVAGAWTSTEHGVRAPAESAVSEDSTRVPGDVPEPGGTRAVPDAVASQEDRTTSMTDADRDQLGRILTDLYFALPLENQGNKLFDRIQAFCGIGKGDA